MPEDLLSIFHGLHFDPIAAGLAAEQKQTVVDLARRGRTGEAALKIGASALDLAERLISRQEAARSLPKPIVCGPGCPFCCANQVELLPPEALVLGDYVARHFSAAELEGLRVGIARNLELRAGKTRDELAPLRPDLLCPLLREGSCAAYPARPLLCRAHHSLQAEKCRREFRAEKVANYEFYSHRYEIVLSVRAGLRDGCEALGCQADALDHVEALRVYLSTDRAAARWMNGERLF
jgi:Fe-S-cluster containining protein